MQLRQNYFHNSFALPLTRKTNIVHMMKEALDYSHFMHFICTCCATETIVGEVLSYRCREYNSLTLQCWIRSSKLQFLPNLMKTLYADLHKLSESNAYRRGTRYFSKWEESLGIQFLTTFHSIDQIDERQSLISCGLFPTWKMFGTASVSIRLS